MILFKLIFSWFTSKFKPALEHLAQLLLFVVNFIND